MKEHIIQGEDLGIWLRSNLWPCVHIDPEQQIEFRNTERCTHLFIQKHAIIVSKRTMDGSCAFESTGLCTVDVDRVVANAVVENCNLLGLIVLV